MRRFLILALLSGLMSVSGLSVTRAGVTLPALGGKGGADLNRIHRQALVYHGPAAASAIITVNSTADTTANDGRCTLREAITAANTDTASGSATGECIAGNGDDTINIWIWPTINLTGQLPTITSNIVFNGYGTTVQRSSGGDYRIFYVSSAASVTVEDLIIRNGMVVNGSGGGVYNAGTLTLIHSTVSNNGINTSVAAGGHGGGIYNTGTLTLANSIVSSNHITTTANDIYGGGIYNAGTLALTHSTVSTNTTYGWHCHGGGIHNVGTLTLTNSIVSSNIADGDGGGIRNIGNGCRPKENRF